MRTEVVTLAGDDWEEADRAYHESPERTAIAPDPARHVLEPLEFRARRVELP